MSSFPSRYPICFAPSLHPNHHSKLHSLILSGFLTHISQRPFPDQSFVDNLLVEVRKLLDLELEEGFYGGNVCGTGLHGVADILEHLSYARFGILEVVFDSLAVEV